MRRPSLIIPLLVAGAMLIPSGMATWASYGSLEPDTGFDRDQGYLWKDGPDPVGCAEQASCATDRIYFNGFTTYGGIGAIKGENSVNPNDATLGSRVEPVAGMGFMAFLGQWTDCNHDGYIGMADGALREYRDVVSAAAGFPVDTSICPSLDDNLAVNQGKVHYNAQGGWVTEMIYLGNDHARAGSTSRELFDAKTRVWVDPGAPVPPVADLSECYSVVFFQTGEASHTGGMLHHVDCDDGHAASATYTLVTGLDSTGTIADAVPNPESLYAPGGMLDSSPLGSSDRSAAMVYGVRDCQGPPAVTTPAVPVGPPGGNPIITILPQNVRGVGSPGVNPQGSVAGTIHEATAWNCGTGVDIYGQVESARASVALKDRSYMPLEYWTYGRQASTSLPDAGVQIAREVACTGDHEDFGEMPPATSDDGNPDNNVTLTIPGPACTPYFGVPGGRAPCDAANVTICGMPPDFGMPWLFQAPAGVAGSTSDTWESTVVYIPPNTVTALRLRQTSAGPGADVFPSDYWTFYVHTELAGYAYPRGLSGGTYGAEWCSVIARGAPAQNGWRCDPDQWNNFTYLNGVPNQDVLGIVGLSFQLRDVDCLDGTLVARDSSVNPTHQDVGTHTGNPGGCA